MFRYGSAHTWYTSCALQSCITTIEVPTCERAQCWSLTRAHRASPSAIPAAHASAALVAASRRWDFMRSYTNRLGPASGAFGATSAARRPLPPLRLISYKSERSSKASWFVRDPCMHLHLQLHFFVVHNRGYQGSYESSAEIKERIPS